MAYQKEAGIDNGDLVDTKIVKLLLISRLLGRSNKVIDCLLTYKIGPERKVLSLGLVHKKKQKTLSKSLAPKLYSLSVSYQIALIGFNGILSW